MKQALNEQLGREAYASYLYLAMASWLEEQGLEGAAKFMYRQSDEEREHMLGIFNYLIEMDARAIVPSVEQPPQEYESVQELFKQAYEHEQLVTRSINDLVNVSIADNDHSTNNFLQWYVEEQREEEALMRTIIDKIGLIGNGPQSLYFIDKELHTINRNLESEEASEK